MLMTLTGLEHPGVERLIGDVGAPCEPEAADAKGATGEEGTASKTTGPGVEGAAKDTGVGGGKQPGEDRLQPEATAMRTLFLVSSSLVASAAS